MATFPSSITVDATKRVRECTLRVHIVGATRTIWRMRLARYWLQLGAYFIGCEFSLDNSFEQDDA